MAVFTREVEIELDHSDLAEIVSEEGLTPGDLFSDAEIQEAAENAANWEGWLEKAIEEMSETRLAEMLAAHGYVKASLARTTCPACGKPPPPDAPCLCVLAPAPATSLMDQADGLLSRLTHDERRAVIAGWNAEVELEIRATVKAEIMRKLFD